MCYRPLHIKSNNVYTNSNVSAVSYDVPCGSCESCRDSYQAMWKCRLWHELDDTYKKNGSAVFLTFTYNNEHLPYYLFNGERVPVFNHDDVKTFLNRLKIRMFRLYGKSSYKYFIAMEYGKNTKRQHLHGLFFLDSRVAWKVFVETCRDLWSENGFMFPKINRAFQYVKDDGSDDTPLIRSHVKGCVYVSKYVTKDLSFYALPAVERLFKYDPTLSRDFGPKHYQSNNLGISILNKVKLDDNNNIVDFLTNGIYLPYSDKKVPVPRYIKKKLLFSNVKSDRIGRNGKFLYDSFPTAINLAVRGLLYEQKALKLQYTIKKTFARYKSLCPSVSIPSDIDYSLLSNYILYFKNVNNNVLHSFAVFFDGDLSAFSDFSAVGHFYCLSKDNRFLKDNQFVTDSLHGFPFKDVFTPALMDAYSLFVKASSYCEEVQVSEFHRRSYERDKVRYKYFYHYPKTLC